MSGAWLTIQNNVITCNYCGGKSVFYLSIVAEFAANHSRCATHTETSSSVLVIKSLHGKPPVYYIKGVDNDATP